MTIAAESQKAIDTYLVALRKQLRGPVDADVEDIVEEIRAHILDKTAGADATDTVAATLASLGTPEELASRYRTDDLLQRAQVTRSPLLSMHSLFRWATLSFAGLVVFLVSVVGYSVGGGLVIVAALKMIWPRATGLWMEFYPDGSPKSASGGFGSGYISQPPPGREIFGWWLVPIGLVLGGALLFLTFRFGTWSIRKFWRPRAWR
jgi:hypothetical protein